MCIDLTNVIYFNYWQIIRNQWGTGWGQGGYIYIQRGVNLCRIEELAAIVNVRSDHCFAVIFSDEVG